MTAPENFIPGGTVVGIACKDGVILAAEKRFAYGRFVVSRHGKKTFKLTDNVGVAAAGMIGDMQTLVREIQSLIKIKELESRTTLSARSIAKLMSVVMFQLRLTPLITQVLVGGVDGEPQVYVLDPLGSVIGDKYAAIGSGAEIAIGVLEDEYRDNIDLEAAKQLAVKSIQSAIQRDAASGDGIDIMVITKNSVREETVPLN
jgi:proteasome beta subunit